MTQDTQDQAKASGSLRLRFLLTILLWVTLGIAAIWYSATSVFETHVEQSYHEELEVHVRELGRLTRIDADGQLELTRPLSDPRYEVPLSGFYWQVTVPGKRPLRSESMTRGALDDEVAHSPEITHVVEEGPTGPAITYGFIRQGPNDEEIHFVIATDQSELDRLIDSFNRELTLWLVVLGAMLAATGIAIISFGLRPLDQLRRAFARLRRGEADRLEGRYPSEIAPLVNDLNAYVRQSGEMIARARVQAGNMAHSLRTPLAVVTDEAERMAEIPGAQASAKVLLEQTRMMEQQVEYHLARTRSAGGVRTPGTVSHLPELLVPILSAMRRLHPDRKFVLTEEDGEGITLPIDPVDLSELLSILLDNAGKWARSAVSVSLKCGGNGTFDIRISDDGPGLSDDQIVQAFDIGTRFDPDTPGSGLGLAIARDICTAMGASLVLEPGETGLVARVGFHGLDARP